MINLLPQTEQKEIRAARANMLLLRYLILLAVAFTFLLTALGITYFSLKAAADQADEAKVQNEQRAIGFTETQAQASQLRNELSSAKTLFTDDIRYSKVLTRLSSLLPEGTALDSIQLDTKSFSQPSIITVYVRDQTAAETLEKNFRASSYVTNASLGKVSTTSGAAHPYRYSVEMSFTFARSIAQ